MAPLSCAIVLAAIIALFGIGRGPAQLPPGATADDRIADRVIGTVGGPVLSTPHGVGAALDAGGTTVWVWSEEPLEPGQRIAATGRLRHPRGFLDPGSPDRTVVTGSRGASWEMSATRIEILADNPGWIARTWRWAAHLHRLLAAEIAGPHSDAARGALDGIVTGDRTRIPPDLDARWRAVGIYHVLSVSGLHLAVIAGLAFALLRRLIAASALGARTRPARWAAPAALVLAVGYTLVTGAQLATLRALLVVAIMLVAQMLDRPVRLIDALGVAAIAILVWRPQDLFDPSFQLSFIAALTLALLPSRDAIGDAPARRVRIWRWLVRGFATSAWVAVTTAPITALHFHQVAAGGVIGNLVLTPLVEIAALPLGLAGAVLGVAGSTLGAVPIDLAVWIVARVDDLAALLAHAMPVGAIAIESPLIAGALVVLALWMCSRHTRSRIELTAWLALCAAWAIAPVAATPGTLRVTFLDVGQGDAALIELPGGAVWLVDSGGIASARDLATASASGETIARTLAVYGHDHIDLAIISHPHPDHYLGLAGLGLRVGELWFVDDGAAARAGAPTLAIASSPTSFARITSELAARGTRLVRPSLGAQRTADGVTLEVWAPRYAPDSHGPALLAPDPVRTVNDNSLVVAITYGGRTLLFAGDLETEGEEALVTAGLPAVDVVKVAHHGSPTSSSPRFVAATRPELAVISCGVANAFGFPSADVLARWRRAGAAIARTDLDGAVTVVVGPTGELVVDRYAHHRP